MGTATRLALAAVILTGIVVALVAVLTATDDAAGVDADNSPPFCSQQVGACSFYDAGSYTPTPTPTPTPTAIYTGPACPGAPSPPGGTCPPCPTFNVNALGSTVGVYSTCFPSPSPTPTPTPYVSPTPCPQVSPTNCDVIYPPLGDADCSYSVNLGDVKEVLLDSTGIEEAQCQMPANVKCDDDLNAVDALLILEFVAQTHPHLPAWCEPFP